MFQGPLGHRSEPAGVLGEVPGGLEPRRRQRALAEQMSDLPNCSDWRFA
jgi:hypothetical protein